MENQLNIADVSNIFTFTPTVSVCLSVCPCVRSSGLSLSIVCYLLQLRYLASLCWFINTYFFPFLCAAFPLWKGVSSTAQTYQRNSRHFSNSRLRVFIKESFLQPSVLGSSWVFFAWCFGIHESFHIWTFSIFFWSTISGVFGESWSLAKTDDCCFCHGSERNRCRLMLPTRIMIDHNSPTHHQCFVCPVVIFVGPCFSVVRCRWWKRSLVCEEKNPIKSIVFAAIGDKTFQILYHWEPLYDVSSFKVDRFRLYIST